MDLPFETITYSPAETQAVAASLVDRVRQGGVIALLGPLGAGKTTFVQGLAEGFGIDERILSPSFVLHRQHGRLHHIDLYRLEDQQPLSELGLMDILEDSTSIVVIEWAEKLENLLPGTIVCRFSIVSDHERRISIEQIR